MSPIPRSLWTDTAAPKPDTLPLKGDARAAVAIIGAGYTGLSAALHLAQSGIDACVLETHEPGWGASGRNGGQVIPVHKYDPPELIDIFGAESGRKLIDFIGTAPDLVFNLIEKHGITCDAVRKGWIQPAHNEPMIGTLKKRAEIWASYGAPIEFLDKAAVSERIGTSAYLWGWLDKRAGGVNPLGYSRGLARAAMAAGARIHGDTPVTRISGREGSFEIHTPSGKVVAEKVVVATNGYTGDLIPQLRKTIIAPNSFQVATKPLPSGVRQTILPGGEVSSDSRRLLNYFRVDASGRLLMGGRGRFHEPSSTALFAHLERAARRTFPQLGPLEFEYHWFGRVALTQDYHPHIHIPQPGIVTALGYIGRGVALATATGRALAQYLAGAHADDLPYPVTPIKPIPFHQLKRIYLSTVASYYRIRDAIG